MKAPKQRVEELDKENQKLHRDIAQLQRAQEQLRWQNEAEIERLQRERKKLQQEVERLKQELEQALRDRHQEAGQISDHGLAVATGRLETRLQQWLIGPYRNPHNQRLAKHLIHEYDPRFTI